MLVRFTSFYEVHIVIQTILKVGSYCVVSWTLQLQVQV